ncbi:glycosyltransferase family 1 protein [Periconia macrospinosa]|uniref:Glycosyltransferase family 1 protein n=1 Tax=Periconia macrospinosa TaxID=97972 RepID=A0A2V1DMA6_9PLEO|nr:glycosyltransferase family 1 protein [Periconia macrospinosa]
MPSPRPLCHKSATERPAAPAEERAPELERAGSVGERLPYLERPTRMEFEPYTSDSSSSSSSSSDDNDDPFHESLDAADPTQQQKGNAGRESIYKPFSRLQISNENVNTTGKVSKRDGRLRLSINETLNSGYIAKTLGAGIRKHLGGIDEEHLAEPAASGKIAPEDDIMEDPKRRVRLNIVVIVIGSRGDIQPFLRIGKILKEDYGHRVRIATHPAFKQFVEKDSGLEFFSIGGDPSELMAFMVKNPGLIPNLETVKEGEIGRRRAAMMGMFQGMWRACVNATDDETDQANLKMMGERIPFVCDAIIANPPSFAPPHIAERLGVPLHMMFTFPYSPTTHFPHPLANIKTSNVDAKYTNFMSYPLVEMMTWQGLGDLINRFRQKTLCLEEVSTLWAPGQLYRLKVPYTYMWSPGLVPKPSDWGAEIEVSGFVFLDLASSFTPPDDLVKFLDAGPPPVYIGFGSIVVDDPDAFTKLIFKAVEIAGVRALVSKGWGGFGGNENAPDNVFMLENTPHDWLFPKVSAVVHHGGAGTTAAGLKYAKPTMIVPFFGDQPFWGAMVSKAKAGAHECIPFKKLTAERLAEGIKQCLTDEAKKNVQKIADSISKEGDGALNAVRSFHRSLPLRDNDTMRCSLLSTHAAVWRIKNTSIRLSALAAEILVNWRKIKWNELRLLRHFEWNDFGGPGEPLTGIWGALVDTVTDVATGVGSIPVQMGKSVKKREKYYEKKHRIKKRQKKKRETLERANKDTPKANGIEKEKVLKEKEEDTKKEEAARPGGLSRDPSTLSQLSEPDELLAEEFAHEAGHGFKKTGGAILKSPMNISVALTQGFHNAPRLYGDETVRRPPRITGFHSGIRAGRDEFVYGVRDGVTGLWMQPYHGARKHGVLGFARGIGFGIGGFVLKDIAAFIGPGAYFMKGLDEEFMKKHQPTNFIRRARIIQGHTELEQLAPRRTTSDPRNDIDNRNEERSEIEKRVSKKWQELQLQIKQERKNSRTGLRAALLGHSKHNEGKRIPLKGSRPTTPHPPATDPKMQKTMSMPINGTQNTSNGHFRHGDKIDGGKHDQRRRATAPSTTQQLEEDKSNSTDLQPSIPENHEVFDAKEQMLPKHAVPGVFRASLEGNGHPVHGRKIDQVHETAVVKEAPLEKFE